MTLSCDLGPADYDDASRFFFRRAARKPLFSVLIFLGVGFLAVVGWNNWRDGLSFAILFTLIFIGMRVNVRWQLRRAVRRTPSAFGRYEWTIDEEGVRIKSAATDATIKWPAFVGFEESRGSFYLMVSPNFAQFIPRRAFATPTEQAEFRALVRSKLPH